MLQGAGRAPIARRDGSGQTRHHRRRSRVGSLGAWCSMSWDSTSFPRHPRCIHNRDFSRREYSTSRRVARRGARAVLPKFSGEIPHGVPLAKRPQSRGRRGVAPLAVLPGASAFLKRSVRGAWAGGGALKTQVRLVCRNFVLLRRVSTLPAQVLGRWAVASPGTPSALREEVILLGPCWWLALGCFARAVILTTCSSRLHRVKSTSAVPQGHLALAYVVSRCICQVTLHVLVCRSFGGDPLGVEPRGRFVWGAAS